jgi:hypothetical protein
MKTAITKIMDAIEMEHNNGVGISQRVIWKMLNEAKEEEKQQIIDFANKCQIVRNIDIDGNITFVDPAEFFESTFNKQTI